MLVDEATIRVKGGRGGAGAVTFGEGKYSRRPSGGNGGNGGNVYLVADKPTLDLARYRYEKGFKAENGEAGRCNKNGADGADIYLKIPRGISVRNLTSGIDDELLNDGEKLLVAKGGLRGRGNRFFSTAHGSEPKKFEPGKEGYEAEIFLELRLIADVGLVGLPNVGKSSLLNALTKAKSRVANYNFTTLEPHLGVLPDGSILADIPGLIEGASEGKGLGTKFLRHIRRTKVILHCVSADSEDQLKDYDTIRRELTKYHKSLGKKDELVALTKKDNLTEKEISSKIKLLAKRNKKILAVSVLDEESLKQLIKKLCGNF